MALRLAGIRLPDQKIGQLSQENVSSSAHSASFRPNVTDHSGNMTDDSGRGRKSVTFNRNRRSRSVGTTGHVQTESAVNLVRNTHDVPSWIESIVVEKSILWLPDNPSF